MSCRQSDVTPSDDAIRCNICGTTYPIIHDVVNTLVNPDPEVVRELEGMLLESKERGESWTRVEELIVRRVPHVASQQEREDFIRGHAKNYFLSTRLSLEQAVKIIDLKGRKTVLEIGAENEFPFLKPFQSLGMDCVATNIHFMYDDPENFCPAVTKIAGDMDKLPFRDEFFDVVLLSATSHHSPNLDQTMSEVARVTRGGGSVLVLNDPIHGAAKHLWDKISRKAHFGKGGGRDGLIHENEFTIGQYRQSFKKHGLAVRASLFPAYYDQKLMTGDVSGVRWSVVAKLVSKLWRIPPLRSAMKTLGLPLGQRIIGLEMNVILEKRLGPEPATPLDAKN